MSTSKDQKKTDSHDAMLSSSFYPRYLAAKKSIDDRSLNQHVWQTLSQLLQNKNNDIPLQILEFGAGIGTMFARMMEWGLLKGAVAYKVTDSDPRQLQEAQNYLSQWAKKRNHTLTWSEKHHGQLTTRDAEVAIFLDVVDVENIAPKGYLPSSYDLIIAHALLDLVDFPVVLPTLFPLLRAEGLAYLTCNFNGETLFLPECADDKETIELYHSSMEKRLKGASRTGKNLLHYLQQQRLEIAAAGSSDWIIHPRKTQYPSDEEFFLHTIIEMVEKELTKKNNLCFSIKEWSKLRHQQAENGQLVFLASHLDFLVRRLPSLLNR